MQVIEITTFGTPEVLRLGQRAAPVAGVGELLILRPDMPRSMHASLNGVVDNLANVANDQSRETQRRAGKLLADLQYARIDEILATGLHAFLTQFLDRVGDLGLGISRDFLVAVSD